jgi:hypothetical protein
LTTPETGALKYFTSKLDVSAPLSTLNSHLSDRQGHRGRENSTHKRTQEPLEFEHLSRYESSRNRKGILGCNEGFSNSVTNYFQFRYKMRSSIGRNRNYVFCWPYKEDATFSLLSPYAFEEALKNAASNVRVASRNIAAVLKLQLAGIK